MVKQMPTVGVIRYSPLEDSPKIVRKEPRHTVMRHIPQARVQEGISPRTENLGRIALVLPRGTSFGPNRATSIDLCVNDFVRNSSFAEQTEIHCSKEDVHYPGFHLHLDEGGMGGQLLKGFRIARRIRASDCKLTIVHQHLPTAWLMAKLLRHPVLLHTHNFQKQMAPSNKRKFRSYRYKSLAGIIFVSEACESHFHSNWPDLNVPTHVVHNGLDMEKWRPAESQIKQIIMAGRAVPEKGILEAARALRVTLDQFSSWRSLLMLTETDRHPEYYAEIQSVVDGSGGKMQIVTNRPIEEVQNAVRESEIALVLSKWDEPFGRTAIEAHASGAALISSGTGGLREVSGDSCIYVNPNDQESVVAAMIKLIADDDFRSHLAERGRRRAIENFSIQKQSAALDRIYEAYLASGSIK